MQKIEANTLVAAVFAIAGVWLILRPLPDYAATVYLIIVDSPDGSSALIPTQSIRFVTSLFSGALLVFGRCRLANWLVPESRVVDYQSQALLSVGVAVVAVYFTLSGLVALGQHIVLMRIQNVSNDYVLWQGLFSTAIGISMFVASVSVARVWSKLRGR